MFLIGLATFANPARNNLQSSGVFVAHTVPQSGTFRSSIFNISEFMDIPCSGWRSFRSITKRILWPSLGTRLRRGTQSNGMKLGAQCLPFSTWGADRLVI
jgi:hypothetical protein